MEAEDKSSDGEVGALVGNVGGGNEGLDTTGDKLGEGGVEEATPHGWGLSGCTCGNGVVWGGNTEGGAMVMGGSGEGGR